MFDCIHEAGQQLGRTINKYPVRTILYSILGGALLALAIALRPAPPVQAVMILTGFGMLISSIGVDLFSYLQKGDVSTPEWIFRIEAEIDQLRKSQLVYSEQGLSEHDREQLRNGLFQHLTEAELKDAIYQAVDRVSISTIVERIAKEKQLDLLRQYYDGVIGVP